MSEEYGIQETVEMVDFVTAVANATDKAGADGFGLEDAALLLPAALKAPQAFSGAAQIPKEVWDADSEEREQIKTVVRKLDLRNDELEAVTEVIINESVEIQAAIHRIVDVVRQARA